MTSNQRRPKAPPAMRKCVTEILGGTKNKEIGGKIYLFVSRENKRVASWLSGIDGPA